MKHYAGLSAEEMGFPLPIFLRPDNQLDHDVSGQYSIQEAVMSPC